MPDLDVVIVNYRSAAHTAKCVAAVHSVARDDAVTVNVVVVNNGDDADALDREILNAGGAVIVHNAANLGFGAACNIGARLGDAAYIYFLNPDTVLQPGALKACVAYLNDTAHQAVGIVGPELSDQEGKVVASCSRVPTLLDLVLRATGVPVLLGGFSNYPFLSLAAHANSRFVGQVMGAALMIRRTLFEKLGGFDERFFLYYEDVDLCARAGAAGAGCYYLKDASVIHFGRASSSHDTGMALALFLRSGLTYARLHFGRAGAAVLLLANVIVELPLRLLRTLGGGMSITGMAVLRAYWLLAASLLSGVGIASLAARSAKP